MARSSKSARLSPLYSDLGLAIFPDRGTASRFANASQAATASVLWRGTGISADLPAPPVFTLDDQIRFFGLGDLPSPPSDRTGSLSPSAPAPSSSSSFVWRTRAEMSGSGAAEVDGEERETGRGSPIDGLVDPGAVITPPPPRPREIVRPRSQGCSMQNRGLGADEWLNSLLMIAVKPIDPMHRQHLDETSDRINRGSSMVSLPSKSTTLNSSSTATPSTVLTRARRPKTTSCSATDTGNPVPESIATPATSALSKVMDLIFGF
ncbi:hypothetical protein B296_00010615 [Ensete ventricosum]|uniref:Uncharacterized protein n=1 Tax=Ensete ventricosum TaxID=4639 RepID=A0A426ZIY8_ENSVE|nr:hypothetical protein B296_00010615 [Ensete ventricosum]